MPLHNVAIVKFLRALLHAGQAKYDGKAAFFAELAERTVRLEAHIVAALISQGIIDGDPAECRPSALTRGWLKREMLSNDPFAGQHRDLEKIADRPDLNLRESPLLRLATKGVGETQAFLERHHLEAGEKVRRLAERARLQPRLTMNYSAAHVSSDKASGRAANIGDLAADARRQLNDIHAVLPRDCAGVVFDVCGLLKGLQVVEQERGWPRRSAKLVLRIGLEQLAQHYGLTPQAIGPAQTRSRNWLGQGARPDRFE